jgi:MFS family permease
VGPLFGFLAGWTIDRFGPRRLMLAGILMAGIAVAGLGTLSAMWMFYAFYFLNALGYVCGGPLPNQVLLSRWFEGGRGRAMGFAYLGIGLGGALVPWISVGLVERFGWHWALRLLGLMIVALAFPLAWFAKEPLSVKSQRASPGGPVPVLPALKKPAFALLALGSMCSIGAVGGTNQHLKLYLRDLDYSQSDAARIISLVLGASLGGRLLMGWLADRFPRKHVMILITLLVAGSIPLLLVPDFPGRLTLFAVVFGIGLGGDYMIIPLMAGDLFGVRVLGRIMGIVLTADGVAEAVSPTVVGALVDASRGSYRTGFVFLIGLALAGFAAVCFLPRRVRPQDGNPVAGSAGAESETA